MKKRFSAIFAITVAAVLVSSLAYASKKKLRAKSGALTPDVSEVDLAANLLDANEDHKYKSLIASDTNKHVEEELKDLKDLTLNEKPMNNKIHGIPQP